jgi:hypothetical protein
MDQYRRCANSTRLNSSTFSFASYRFTLAMIKLENWVFASLRWLPFHASNDKTRQLGIREPSLSYRFMLAMIKLVNWGFASLR